MTLPSGRRLVVGLVVVVVGLGLAIAGSEAYVKWRAGQPVVDPATVARVDPARLPVVCGSVDISGVDLTALPAASTLSDFHRDALVAAFSDPDFYVEDETWRVVRADDEILELLRVPVAPDREYDFDVTGAADVEGGWAPYSSGPCTPRLTLPDDVDVDVARVTLAAQPGPSDTRVALDVREPGCSSGRSAEGRIVELAVTQTADEVGVLLGVVPLRGPQTCPGPPPTPYTLELETPVGDATVIDLQQVPAAPMPVTGPFGLGVRTEAD